MRSLPLLAVSALMLSACVLSPEAALRKDLDTANRCVTADDCVLIGSKCPFDCYLYTHKDEAEAMRTRVSAFPSSCQYSCIASSGVDCVQGKCKVLLAEGPPPEGNAGEACASDADCATPMEYLTRSSCPFQSQCIAGKCAVTCPMFQDEPNAETGFNETVRCTEDAQCDCAGYAGDDKTACKCTPSGCAAVVK